MSLLAALRLKPTKAMIETAQRARQKAQAAAATTLKQAQAAAAKTRSADASGFVDVVEETLDFDETFDLGGIRFDGSPAEKKDGPTAQNQSKSKTLPVFGGGKTGVDHSRSTTRETTDGRGGSAKRVAAFGGKATIETAEVPGSNPPAYELTFSFSAKVRGSASAAKTAKDDPKGRNGRFGVSAEVGAWVSFSVRHRLDSAALNAYLAAALSGGGTQPELRVAAQAQDGIVADLDALLAQVRTLGGSVEGLKAMADGDEANASLGGNVEVGASAGWKAIGAALGQSTKGSLARTIGKRGKLVVITLAATAETSRHGSASASAHGVGMSVGGSTASNSAESVSFELPVDHPRFEQAAQALLAATSVEQMRALRRAFSDVPSYDLQSRGESRTQDVGVGVLGVNLGIGKSVTSGHEKLLGPDGAVAEVFRGGGGRSAELGVGGVTIAKTGSVEDVVAGADGANRGFGETTMTETESSLLGSVKAALGDAASGPGKALGLLTGDEEFGSEEVRIEGMAMDDASFARIATLARRSAEWERCAHVGAVATMKAWDGARRQILAAKGDRRAIAQALAEFGKGSSRGRYETLRRAITGHATPFEFPDTIRHLRKDFDRLAIDDSIGAALRGRDELQAIEALRKLDLELGGLREKIVAARQSFRRPEDGLDMGHRIDLKRRRLRAELQRREKLLGDHDPVEQVSVETLESRPGDDEASQAQAEALERVEELKEKIREAHEIEQRVFAKWADALQGEELVLGLRTKADTRKLSAHEKTLRQLYVQWDAYIAELRQVLAEAGPGHDPVEAEAVQPNRRHAVRLMKAAPHAGWRNDFSI